MSAQRAHAVVSLPSLDVRPQPSHSAELTSQLLLGETVPSNLALGLVLVMAGVAAMTIPGEQYVRWLKRLRTRGA